MSNKISLKEKGYELIITEKPQAALKIAQALGSAKQDSFNKVPYYEVSYNNEKIIVASAVGHLYNLTYKPGQKGYPNKGLCLLNIFLHCPKHWLS